AAAEAAGEAAGRGTEVLLGGVSVTVAVLGFILAYVLYVSKPYLPQKIADSLGDLYQAVLDKYYVDELYTKLFVKPLIDGSTSILWQGIDRKVIDDTVNNAADGARHLSDEVRHMQSGNLRSYAGWIAAGSAVVIAYMIWMGVR
ncbi:MAG TPA: NADH-quinone oxidoreductase subunit L, partial [Candidatus Sulfotelmatobacter sp.]